MKMKSLKTVLVAATMTGLASSASAAEMVSGEEIRAHVSDKTVQGSMLRDTFQKYSEFYMGDGTIRGDGYTGKWSISDDSMCFEYEGESSGCWEASIEGAAIIWWKDGAVDGAAVAKAGNGNEY